MSSSPRRRGRAQRTAETESVDDQAPVWPGVMGGRFKPLNPDEVAQVEEAALHLLETLGLAQAIRPWWHR